VSGATTATPSVNAAGTYTLTVTDPSNGCSASSTVTVSNNSNVPNANAGSTQSLTCSVSTVILNASSTTAGATYSWSGPGVVSGSNSAVATVNAAGTYTVTVTNPSNGCTASAGVIVTAPSGINVNAGSDITLIMGEAETLTATGASSYNWTPSEGLSCTSCPSPVATPSVTTTYCVAGTDGSCSDNDCITITVNVPCGVNSELGVPNAFSPNNDGINDEFCLQGWGECMEIFNVMIFDRWGEKVFEANESDFCWNGTFRGKILDPAVFVYIINATYTTGESKIKKGNISIIR
jgi:gliding motility-associated-like protein